MNPKIDRGFFLAEGEWTCYRRNYFQISLAYSCTDAETGEEMTPENLKNLVISDPAVMGQNSIPISGFAMCVSARIASGERKIDLVQHTPKRDKGPQIIPTPRQLINGGNPHQPFSAGGPSGNTSVATFERMQFKTATATNGKRRVAQQFYTITIELYAVSAWDGSFILAGYSESNCLVVRGRSPGHYVEGGLLLSPSMRASHSLDTGSPQTPISSFSSPMAFPTNVMSLTPQMSESILPVGASLLSTHANSDVFVLSQHPTHQTFNPYNPVQSLWADNSMPTAEAMEGRNYGGDYDFTIQKGVAGGYAGEMPITPKSTDSESLFYEAMGAVTF
jgi:hypothetical protein